jgi:hypothetical protein
MIKYLLACAAGAGLMIAISAQAAPVVPSAVGIQGKTGNFVEKVYHCRRWSGGWRCGRRWWR